MASRWHGMGLGTLILIGCLLAYSGALPTIRQKIGEGLSELGLQCHSNFDALGNGLGASACNAVAEGVRLIGIGLDEAGELLVALKDSVVDGINSVSGGKDVSMSEVINTQFWQSVSGSESLQSLSSSVSELQSKISRGPGSFAEGSDQIRAAVDSYVIGQRYLSDGASGRALPWLQQGARMSEYGVLSQIKLAELYSQGGSGVRANPQLAAQYYSQASQSIGQLRVNNSTQARQLLQSLGTDPQALQQEMLAQAGKLRGVTGR